MDQNCKIRDLYSNDEDYSRLLSELISIDEFGFLIENQAEQKTHSSAGFKLHRAEWYDILDRYDKNRSKMFEIIRKKKLLQQGVPILLRNRLWKVLLFGDQQPGQCEEKYKGLVEKASEYDYQIHVDIQRTFRRHYLFKNQYGRGQSELFNILVAFANAEKRIGYCQGMSDIAAVFLMHYEESEAFEMMAKFFRKNGLYRIFDKRFSGMPGLIKEQIGLLRQTVPGVLAKMPAELEMILVSWYLTLFTRFEIKLCLRIWDYMMFYGFSACLYFVCAIFKVNEIELVSLKEELLIQAINKIEKQNMDENQIIDQAMIYIKEYGNKKKNKYF